MSNVIPIRDLWGEANYLIGRMDRIIASIPGDDLREGYRLSAQTRANLRSSIPLLRDAYQLLRQAAERENPIFNAYCASLDCPDEVQS